jgi:hypothetical protein
MIASIVQPGHLTIADLILFVGLAAGGFAAWKSKRGDFYKSTAEERGAENTQLRAENLKLRGQKDIEPIMNVLRDVVAALDRQTKTSDAVFKKVADMNGSLRHTGDAMRQQAEAMRALADRLILDEAARGLLIAAAERKPPTRET